MAADHAARGLTTREVARRYRVGEDKVRAWIRRGTLPAIDTGAPGRPRYVVLPEHLAALEDARRVRLAPGPVRRDRKRICGVDYYPGP
jgi:excisionase family DNA binding protein